MYSFYPMVATHTVNVEIHLRLGQFEGSKAKVSLKIRDIEDVDYYIQARSFDYIPVAFSIFFPPKRFLAFRKAASGAKPQVKPRRGSLGPTVQENCLEIAASYSHDNLGGCFFDLIDESWWVNVVVPATVWR